MNTVENNFNELTQLGLSTFGEEYAEYATEQHAEAMATLWDMDATPKHVADLTLEDLLKQPFDVAHKYINQFTMVKRINMLNKLTDYRNHLYNETGKFGAEGLPKEEQLSAKNFRSLLGKIKHLEILQNWLYGID